MEQPAVVALPCAESHTASKANQKLNPANIHLSELGIWSSLVEFWDESSPGHHLDTALRETPNQSIELSCLQIPAPQKLWDKNVILDHSVFW